MARMLAIGKISNLILQFDITINGVSKKRDYLRNNSFRPGLENK